MIRYLLLFVLTAFLSAGAGAMQELDSDALDDISAGQGIALSLNWRINAQASGTPESCPTVGSAADCRLAFGVADRSGAWVVMKGYRGILQLDTIFLDAANLGSAWTGYTVNGTAQSPYLNGYDPRSKPSLRLSAGRWARARAAGGTTFNSYMNSATFRDLSLAWSVNKLSAEFDCGASVNLAVGIRVAGCSSSSAGWSLDRVPGYLRDAVSGAAISLRYADGAVTSNAPMQVRLDGRLNVFGY